LAQRLLTSDAAYPLERRWGYAHGACTLDNDLTEAPSTTVEQIAISIGTADEMPDRRDDRSSIGGLEPTFECPRESLGKGRRWLVTA
jgi:hypothetical protein